MFHESNPRKERQRRIQGEDVKIGKIGKRGEIGISMDRIPIPPPLISEYAPVQVDLGGEHQQQSQWRSYQLSRRELSFQSFVLIGERSFQLLFTQSVHKDYTKARAYSFPSSLPEGMTFNPFLVDLADGCV